MSAVDPALESELLDVAVEAARAAAAELTPRWRHPIEVGTKSTPTDPVSAADIAAEGAIRAVLGRRRPTDAILGEEGGQTGSGELRWVVDPLDGTVNYLYGKARFAVSVAVEDSEGGIAGVVLDPSGDELFSATRSAPARSNGVVLVPSEQRLLDHALVGTGFGYDAAVRSAQGEVVARLLPQVRDIRRAGAAALDLCDCACGRLDAYYERGVKHWDVAAGVVICERAGLSVRMLAPTDTLPDGILVAPTGLIDELHALVA